MRDWEWADGGGGRVAAWACLAFMRDRREEERERVDSFFGVDVVVVVEEFGADGMVWGFFFAVVVCFCVSAVRMSWSLRWPFAREGEILSRERQFVMGCKGRFDMNVVIGVDFESDSVSELEGGWDLQCSFQRLVRLDVHWIFKWCSSSGRAITPFFPKTLEISMQILFPP